MKTYTIILSTLLLSIFHSSLFAKDSTALIQCLDQELHLIIKNKHLNLTEEALVDNTGGYVDIPEERHYIKLDQKAYKLKGVVLRDQKNHTNIFTAPLNDQLSSFIDRFTQKNSVKFIQKIDLEEKNTTTQSQNITTTNILNLSFDKTNIKTEYQKCKKK